MPNTVKALPGNDYFCLASAVCSCGGFLTQPKRNSARNLKPVTFKNTFMCSNYVTNDFIGISKPI